MYIIIIIITYVKFCNVCIRIRFMLNKGVADDKISSSSMLHHYMRCIILCKNITILMTVKFQIFCVHWWTSGRKSTRDGKFSPTFFFHNFTQFVVYIRVRVRVYWLTIIFTYLPYTAAVNTCVLRFFFKKLFYLSML